MITIYGKIEKNSTGEMCVDKRRINSIFRKHIGKNVIITISNPEPIKEEEV
jgi:hypothetical protein